MFKVLRPMFKVFRPILKVLPPILYLQGPRRSRSQQSYRGHGPSPGVFPQRLEWACWKTDEPSWNPRFYRVKQNSSKYIYFLQIYCFIRDSSKIQTYRGWVESPLLYKGLMEIKKHESLRFFLRESNLKHVLKRNGYSGTRLCVIV